MAKRNLGFTLIELVIVIAVSATLFGIIGTNYFGTRNRIAFENQVNEIAADLRWTMSRSLAQESDDQWGIRFHNPDTDDSDFYEIWYGASYAAGTVASRTNLHGSVAFSDPVSGATEDIIFSKATGLPVSEGSVVIVSGDLVGIVAVNSSGRISSSFEEGLVGYWKFDEGAGASTIDSSGNGNNGTRVNDPIWTVESSCKQSACLDFDGSNDRIAVSDDDSLDITGSVSVAAWVYPNTFGSGNDEDRIVLKGQGWHVNNLYTLDLDESQAVFTLHGDAPDSCAGSLKCARGSTILSANTWYHITGTYNGADIKVYVNGVEDGTNNVGSITGTANNENLQIGGRSDSTDMFDGFIDEVRIYNRALSADEIQKIYNNTK